jgi:hypothetical protein
LAVVKSRTLRKHEGRFSKPEGQGLDSAKLSGWWGTLLAAAQGSGVVATSI